MRQRRLRVEGLSWRDEHGVVHAMFDDEYSEYSPPFTLVSACGLGHYHDHSARIRKDGRNDPTTCLECLYKRDVSWLLQSADDAPCCELGRRGKHT